MTKLRIPFVGLTLTFVIFAADQPAAKLTDLQKMHFRALVAEQQIITERAQAEIRGIQTRAETELKPIAAEINESVAAVCQPLKIPVERCEIDFKTGSVREKKAEPEKK